MVRSVLGVQALMPSVARGTVHCTDLLTLPLIELPFPSVQVLTFLEV